MKKHISHIIALATIAGFLAIAPNTTHAQTTDPLLTDSVDQSEFPQITAQPVDQAVPIGSSVVLSVQANNADGYQWQCNGVPVEGQTNSILVIQNAGINNVGLYSCNASLTGGGTVPTRAASVSVETTASPAAVSATVASTPAASALTANALTTSATTSGAMAASMPAGGPIIVFGTPYPGGGSQGSCPGPYAGLVAYSKTISQGWGWAPISGTKVLTAADGSGRTDTKIQYFGAYGDSGCAQTTVTIPYPPFSPVYRFGIYFTSNVPTTNAYPIVLTGFNP